MTMMIINCFVCLPVDFKR